MKEIAIHPSHRNLAITTFMHMDHKTGRIKVEDIPVRLLEMFLKQNLEIVRTLDELNNLSMVAYTAGDTDWLHDICGAIDYVKEESFIKKGE